MTTSEPPPFTFPTSYSFPPFFTLQPTSSTLHAQSLKWSSLILSYCRHHRLFRLSLSASLSTPLFTNSRINRALSEADAREMIEFMRKQGRAEYVNTDGAGTAAGKGGAGGDAVWVYWRTPEEWAGVIEGWVEGTAQKNTVLTLYELSQGDATLGQEFHDMDPDLLQKALAILVKRGKAQVFGQESEQGVKFF